MGGESWSGIICEEGFGDSEYEGVRTEGKEIPGDRWEVGRWGGYTWSGEWCRGSVKLRLEGVGMERGVSNVWEEWGKWIKWGTPERPAGFWWGVEKRERCSTEEGRWKLMTVEYGVWVGCEPLRERRGRGWWDGERWETNETAMWLSRAMQSEV